MVGLHRLVARLPFVLGAVLGGMVALSGPPPAHAQSSDCILGTNCCVTAMNTSRPHRYTLACDGNAQSASNAAAQAGYPLVMFGPASRERASGWMNAANIPGWAQYPGTERYTNLPKPDSECTPGKTCCVIGSTPGQPVRYARAYDGATATAWQKLMEAGYSHPELQETSPEYCHFWWNTKLAARGLVQPIASPTPRGAVSFTPLGGTGPQPAPGQTVTIPTNPRAWVRQPPSVGPLQAGQGNLLVVRGGAWTNGQVRNGVRDGNHIRSAQSFDLSGGGEIFIKFSLHGGGKYMWVVANLFVGAGIQPLSTHHAFNNSVVVPDDQWLYGHMVVQPGGAYTSTIARGNYDSQGGQVIARGSGQLNPPAGQLELRFVDNYAGTAAGIVVGEARVTIGGGTGRPSGGSCSTDADCPGSVCLLGVCAK